MTALMIMKRWVSIGVTALCGAGLVLASAAPAAAWRDPDADGLANPGVIQRPDGRWVVHSTGGIGGHNVGVSNKTTPGGSYRVTKRALLDRRPSWVPENDQGVWAPSVVRSATGQYVVFYAARVKGTKTARCIGTGTGMNPAGPFKHSERALACWQKSGTNPWDKIKSEGSGFSLIDPTPAWVRGRLVLTYKTGKKNGRWHTTTRMVELDPNDPTRTRSDGHRKSIKLTNWRNKYIEENPVLVEHGGKLTLFTSRGWYGTCRYSTVYRQNRSLWTGWLKKKPTALPFTKKPNTCGTGNAEVVKESAPGGRWLYFFNGHTQKSTPGGPKGLYVGQLTWSHGRPRVAKLL